MCELSASPQSSEAGFSLLEALIGFAVLAMTLAAVFNAGMLGLHTTLEARQRTEAILEARSLIDRIGLDIPLAAGTLDGKTALGHTYHLNISPVSTKPGETLRAYLIAAHVLEANSDKPIVNLHTLRTANGSP